MRIFLIGYITGLLVFTFVGFCALALMKERIIKQLISRYLPDYHLAKNPPKGGHKVRGTVPKLSVAKVFAEPGYAPGEERQQDGG